MELVVRRLEEADDRRGFRSGDLALDLFFERYAGQNQFRLGIGTTYVAVDGVRIVGYMTVAGSAIHAAEIPSTLRKRLPAYPLPVLRLARLAVHQDVQNQGIGGALLRHACALADAQARDVGCIGIVADAKAGAGRFYERFGFAVMPVESGELDIRAAAQPMFLPMGRIPRR